MKLQDFNLTLKPPEGHIVTDVRAEGAYLRVEYRALRVLVDPNTPMEVSVIVVYLNDQGREVVRSLEVNDIEEPPVQRRPYLSYESGLSSWEKTVLWLNTYVNIMRR